MRDRKTAVGTATGYGLDGPGIESRWGVRFSAPVQTGDGGPSSLLHNGQRVPFLGVRRPRRAVAHPTPTIADVKGRVELVFHAAQQQHITTVAYITTYHFRLLQ